MSTLSNMREITFVEAISEATVQAMEKDKGIFIIGEGVDDATGIFGTTRQAFLKFGKERVMDTPLSEEGITGVALGAGIMGKHALVVYARADFMLLAMNQIINHAAKWSYTYGGKMMVPLTLRAIVGRGWGQGPQHSQSLHSLFVHIPGLKVIMPVTPFDAKGLLIASLEEKCPVIFLEHRWLHKEKGLVPEEYYSLPLGKARLTREGKNITIIGISYGVVEALKAAEFLAQKGIEAEVIDLCSLKPWDKEMVFNSIKKTGRLIIIDTAWKMCGLAAEIAAEVAEEAFSYLKAPIKRLSFAEAPTPTSFKLEEFFYPNSSNVVSAAIEIIGGNLSEGELAKEEYVKKFEGSF